MSKSMYLFCDYLSELLCKQSKEMIGLRFVDGFFGTQLWHTEIFKFRVYVFVIYLYTHPYRDAVMLVCMWPKTEHLSIFEGAAGGSLIHSTII